jgi:ArsR family transcriptional regulator
MKRDIIEKYEKKAKIFKALAHPTRIFIFEELSKKEMCVCELTSLIGDDITTVSKHLSIIKEAGLVGNYKTGNRVVYFLKDNTALDFITCVEKLENCSQGGQI